MQRVKEIYVNKNKFTDANKYIKLFGYPGPDFIRSLLLRRSASVSVLPAIQSPLADGLSLNGVRASETKVGYSKVF